MNYETVTLKTKRLTLKKGEKEDFLKVYEYDFSKLENIDNENTLVKKDLSKVEKLFKNNNYYKKAKKAHVFDWMVFLDNEVIANILASECDGKGKIVQLEFNMHPTYWRNGYMTESLICVLEYLFSIGYNEIICSYLECNTRVKNLLGKLGFKPYMIIEEDFKTPKGNLLDEYKVIMTKEDWFSKTGNIKIK